MKPPAPWSHRVDTMTSTYFDYLPTADILHECIAPCLDYESRIQFNCVLPPVERFRKRLAAHDILVHDYCVQYDRMTSQLNYVRTSTKPIDDRCQLLATVLSACLPTGRYVILLRHNDSLRQAVINKCLAIAEPDNDVLGRASDDFKTKIRQIASHLLSEILDMKTGAPIQRPPKNKDP